MAKTNFTKYYFITWALYALFCFGWLLFCRKQHSKISTTFTLWLWEKNITYTNVKNNATSECDIKKFTEYIFKDNIKSNGKNIIFTNLGFTIADSSYLQQEYCKQALEQYLLGNYKLKNLDCRGQRLAIPINLNGTKFYSGWMLYPEGKIINTTPFGGWINETIWFS